MMGYINYHQKQYNEVLYYLEIEYKKISEYERIIIVCLKLLTNIKLKNYHNIENLILFLIRNTNFKYSSLILEMVLRLLLEEKEVNLFNKTYSQFANCANTNINKIIKNYSKINNNNFNQYDLIEIYNKATTLGLNDAINYSINKLIHFFYFNNDFEEACNWQNKHRLNTPKKIKSFTIQRLIKKLLSSG